MTESSKENESVELEKKAYSEPQLKTYSAPKLTKFGDLRDVSKGTAAYSLEEGAYQEMNPPS